MVIRLPKIFKVFGQTGLDFFVVKVDLAVAGSTIEHMNVLNVAPATAAPLELQHKKKSDSRWVSVVLVLGKARTEALDQTNLSGVVGEDSEVTTLYCQPLCSLAGLWIHQKLAANSVGVHAGRVTKLNPVEGIELVFVLRKQSNTLGKAKARAQQYTSTPVRILMYAFMCSSFSTAAFSCCKTFSAATINCRVGMRSPLSRRAFRIASSSF